MHLLKLTLIFHLVVFTAATNCCKIVFPKEYRISFAASCVEYSLILVKLIFPNNIHTTDKKQKLIFHSMLSKQRPELEYVGVLLMAKLLLYGVLIAYKVGTLTIL
jgi:hypothetical protein